MTTPDVERMVAFVASLPEIEAPLVHRFTPGLYIREMSVKRDSVLVGKKHLTEHPYVLSKGKMLVWIDGVKPILIEAPFTGVTPANTRRYAIAVEDSIWTTFHVTEETDPDKVIEKITEPEDFSQIVPREAVMRLNVSKKDYQCPLLQS